MCNGTPFAVEKISPGVRIELGSLDQISKPALNTLSYRGSDFHGGNGIACLGSVQRPYT